MSVTGPRNRESDAEPPDEIPGEFDWLEKQEKELAALRVRVQELEAALRWIAGNTTEAHIHHSAAAILGGAPDG